MRVRRAALVGCTVGLAGLVACGGSTLDPIVCTEILVYGLSVEVRNGQTGEPEAEGAVGTAVDGDHTESLMVIPTVPPARPLAMVGAPERPGTYDVTVSKAGFREWTASSVTVTADECHVIPVRLEANLVPLP